MAIHVDTLPLRRSAPALPTAWIAAAAVRAIRTEAGLTPKPGLVDARGNRSHPDMSVALLEASAESLRGALRECADAAREHPLGLNLRAQVGVIGRTGERRMRSVTGGVNTHRGALWALGLLAAGAANVTSSGYCVPSRRVDTIHAAAAYAGELAAVPDIGAPDRVMTNGQRAWLRYGTGGALSEARSGFPHVVHVGLPALWASRRRGEGEECAALNALIAIMASLDDTCVLHRGGPRALDFVHRSATGILEAGGCATATGRRKLEWFCVRADWRRLSMGGSADLLSATLFCDLLPLSNGA
ncbi:MULTISPECIES: triphosphoribosyl-dephospho-CoA synthase MdcB [unclassified Mycobacterium]|uniref:triphosphoribosyl-dephospho-CoA synthase MdcB n=1 Tax=unclassified Mycobacterium TaxID=2642494 RepID=UPI0029C6FC5B|nr:MULTISPECIES: triphosphoribosyl-dephospho-CoA synthase MdcB [unclassified Mycobacterium]